ncbi:MAG: hypothetical protein HY078_04090 [Elusimicrobia bacterium]|nr:hypothetical protein [Elusimicrobiota bacterium]
MILPTCKEVSTAVARGDFAEANAFARLGALLHLAICQHCRKFKRQLAMIAFALRPRPDPAAVSALQKKLLQRLAP